MEPEDEITLETQDAILNLPYPSLPSSSSSSSIISLSSRQMRMRSRSRSN
jgi:hypothetical protein